MQFAGEIKNAMIEKGISKASILARESGVSYFIVLRLLKNDGSCRLNDLKKVVDYLGIKTVIGG